MAKDPAFLFYSKDWLEGTAEMTPDEKGVYIDLLAHQHQKGDLPSETKRLAKLVGLSEPDFLVIWGCMGNKFKLNKDNRLVNRKLTEVVTERLEKGHKNKIISALAIAVRQCNFPQDIKSEAKKGFRVDDFMEVPLPKITESVTEWYAQRLNTIANGNANGNANANNNINSKWYLLYYHSNYDFYKSKFNGQATTEENFNQWKKFIDFLYSKKYDEVFECKFINPHDFGKLENFTEDRWDDVIKKILSTGIKPEHNLFFRIPEFLKISNKENGTNKQPVGTNRFTEGGDKLLGKAKKLYSDIARKQGN